MLLNVVLGLLATTAALAAPTKRDATSDLITKLGQTNGAVARNQILAQGGNASFAFDFANPPPNAVISSPAGKLVTASGQTFPALTGFPISLAIVTVEPCGLVLPHIHPRAEEFAFVTEGHLFTQFLAETGAALVSNDLQKYGGTMFPRGSIHLEYNPECTRASFVAAFNDNDPGVSFVAPGLFSLEDQLVIATLGEDAVVSGKDLESIRQAIPLGLATSVEYCLKKCNIKPHPKRSLAEVFAQ